MLTRLSLFCLVTPHAVYWLCDNKNGKVDSVCLQSPCPCFKR